MIATQTWRIGSGLIDWTYNLVSHSELDSMKKLVYPVQRREWLAEKTEVLLDALEGFALVDEVTADTRSRGEDTLAIDEWHPQASRSELLEFLRITDDVVHIDFTLNLKCLAPVDGAIEEFQIDWGGNIFIFIDLDDEGNFEPITDDIGIWFTFFLDADIYAPLSWGEIRDNAQLAELNQPRLSAFLHRLEEELGAEFLGVSAPDYPGMVERYGFVALGDREEKPKLANSLAQL